MAQRLAQAAVALAVVHFLRRAAELRLFALAPSPPSRRDMVWPEVSSVGALPCIPLAESAGLLPSRWLLCGTAAFFAARTYRSRARQGVAEPLRAGLPTGEVPEDVLSSLCKNLRQTLEMEELESFASAIPDDDLAQLVESIRPLLRPEDVQPGDLVCRQGEGGSTLYVVERGSFAVHIRQHGEIGLGKKVNDVGSGTAFGELSLLYGELRSATVLAVSEGRLWCLDLKDFRRIMTQATQVPMQIRQSFRGNGELGGLFWTLPELDFIQLCQRMYSKQFLVGEVVVAEGDVGTCFYVVDYGSFRVSSSDQTLTNLGPGDSFGELALLYDKPRRATVSATADSRVWVLERKAFADAVATAQQSSITQSTVAFLRGVKMFAGLPEKDLQWLSLLARPKAVRRGEILAEAGEAVTRVFLLRTGEVKALASSESEEDEEVVYRETGALIDKRSLCDPVWPVTIRSTDDATIVLWISKLTLDVIFEGTGRLLRNEEGRNLVWWPFF